MSEHTTGGAGCALHPDAPAMAVCDRCGAYMCMACNDAGRQRLCPTCRARTGAASFPLNRDAWSLDALFGIAWQAFKRYPGELIVAALIFFAATFAVSMIREVLVVGVGQARAVAITVLILGVLVQYAVQGVLQLGFIDMGFDAVDGRRVLIATLFHQVGKVGKLVLQYLVVLAILLIPLGLYGGLVALGLAAASGSHAVPIIVGLVLTGLLLLIPLLWLTIPLSFMQYELALDDDVGPVESIRRCYALAQGRRLAIFGVSFLAGLVIAAGALACGVGVLATMPLGQLVLSGLFLALRNGSGLPPPVRRGGRDRAGIAPPPAGPVAARPAPEMPPTAAE